MVHFLKNYKISHLLIKAFFRHLPHRHVPLVVRRLRPRHPEEHGVLGHRRTHDGAMLCAKVLPGDRHMRQ